jgi:hypothetical protein
MAIHSSAPLRGWLAAVLATPFLLLTLMSATTAASAQTIGTDPRNKRCQTLLTCNYARGGLYRV